MKCPIKYELKIGPGLNRLGVVAKLNTARRQQRNEYPVPQTFLFEPVQETQRLGFLVPCVFDVVQC